MPLPSEAHRALLEQLVANQGDSLPDLIRAARSDGKDWTSIAESLKPYGVTISRYTLARWYADDSASAA